MNRLTLDRLAKRALVGAGLVAMGLTGGAAELLAQRPGGRSGPDPLPLPAARKAEFTATEGTWISLDVSPDGEQIVFDLLGDIYTLPIEGGTATRITEGMAYDAQPRYSPDGESVVFVSDRSGGQNVWTMRLDFTDTTQVTQGNNNAYVSPTWLPDGEHVVVSRGAVRGGVMRLVQVNVNRSAPVSLAVGPPSRKTLGAAASPDGRYIWYAGRTGDWNYNALFPEAQLYRYDREDGTNALMTSRYGSGFRPQVSPDGRYLVYGTRENAETGLRIRDLDTGDERWLAYPVQRDELESRAPLDQLPGYAFTPDSEAIVVSYGGQIWRVPVDGSDPSHIPFEAHVEVGIGPEVSFDYEVPSDSAVTSSQIRHPVASPDGRYMAFTAFDRLWVREMPDGEPRRLTDADEGEFLPTWSPDSRWIAYTTWSDADGGHIMRVRADGTGQPEQLTTRAALYYNAAWSPDGARIAATRAAARQLKDAPDTFFGPIGGEFVWIPADGGEATVIAPTGGRDVLHFTNSEPERLYAYSPFQGLVSFRWDGTDVKAHLQVRGINGPSSAGLLEEHEWVPIPRRVFPVEGSIMRGDRPDAGSTGEAGHEGPPLETGGPGQPAGLILISPRGGEAVAQVGNQIYSVGIPAVGGAAPTVLVSQPQGAPVPVRRLTDVGGEFPSWSGDGERVHYAIGNAVFTYNLRYVEARADSARAERRAEVARNLERRAIADSLKAVRARADSIREAEDVVPDSLTSRINALLADSVQLRADSIRLAIARMERQASAIVAHADSVRAGLDSVRAETDEYVPHEERYSVTMPRDIPSGSVVLRGGRVITMNGDSIVENADVVVTDNRIVAVGASGEVEVPEDAEIVDVRGRTLIPGFVDTHYHAQWLVPEVHSGQVWQYLTNLAYGVTTTRDPQTASTDILTYQDRVETGDMLGPRIFSTGPGVFIQENIRNAEHAEEVLRRYSDYYNTHTLKMYMTGNRQQRQWILQAAKKLEIMPTTEGGLNYRMDITHAMDGYPGVEHALPIAPIYSDVVELFKASQTTNSPTLLVAYGGPFGENYFYATEEVHDDPKMRAFSPPASLDTRTRRRGPGTGGSPGQGGWFHEDEHVFPRHAEFIRDLVEGGGRAGVGSHGQLQGLGYHWELWAMASGGISTHDALRTATIMGAEAIGFENDLGSIEEGKLADILILSGDPLEDIRNSASLTHVMKNGRLYEADTLNEVWPRQRALPTPPWRNLSPEGVSGGIR
jgi:Tol biopolymer transport system component